MLGCIDTGVVVDEFLVVLEMQTRRESIESVFWSDIDKLGAILSAVLKRKVSKLPAFKIAKG